MDKSEKPAEQAEDKDTVTLSKPLTVGENKEVTSIKVNEPNAGAIMQHGIPFTESGVNMVSAMGLLEAATGIQLPFLKKLGGRDTIKLVNKLAGILTISEDDAGN